MGKKGSWIVTMTVTGTHSLVCENCTEEEARTMPYSFVVEDTESDISDWEVLSVKENT